MVFGLFGSLNGEDLKMKEIIENNKKNENIYKNNNYIGKDNGKVRNDNTINNTNSYEEDGGDDDTNQHKENSSERNLANNTADILDNDCASKTSPRTNNQKSKIHLILSSLLVDETNHSSGVTNGPVTNEKSRDTCEGVCEKTRESAKELSEEEGEEICFKTPYVCSQDCHKISSSVDQLKHHLVTRHTLSSDHLCSLCNCRFPLFDKFFQHLPTHYKENKVVFKCYTDGCHKLTHRFIDFKTHVSTQHSSSSSLLCSFCFKSKPSHQVLIDHLQKHLRNVCKCVYCESIFLSKEAILNHLQTTHLGKPRKINIETEIAGYDRWEAQQKPAETGVASTDSGISINRTSLVYIRQVQELSHSCFQCSFKTFDEASLSYHTHHHHFSPKESLLFNCLSCYFSSNDKFHFVEHLAFHCESLNFECFICPYCTVQTTEKSELEDHLKTRHTNEMVTYSSELLFSQHLGNLAFCPLCSHVFLWKERLCGHVREVHGENDLAEAISKHPERLSEVVCVRYCQSNTVLGELILSDNVKMEEELFDNDEKEEEKKVDSAEVSSLLRLKFLKRKRGHKALFTCPLCPFRCSKTMNFKRHQAIHLKAGLLKNCLKCGYCEFRHSRMNCIKFHLGRYHMHLPIKIIRVNEKEESEIQMVSSLLDSKKMQDTPEMHRLLSKSELDQYCDSIMPAGMIFKEAVKCTFCDYSNKVRVNLRNHLRFHLEGKRKAPLLQNEEQGVENLQSQDYCKEDEEARNDSSKKVYKCAYCSMVSKWNKRDIVLHILHIHMLKKVYSCPYCHFGSSKSNQVVIQHCKQFHSNKPSLAKNEFRVLKRIAPVKTEGSLIPIAYISDEVGPIMNLKDLSLHLQISVRKTKYDAKINFDDESFIETPKIKEEKVSDCLKTKEVVVEEKNSKMVEEVPHADEEEEEEEEEEENVHPDEADGSEWKCLFCLFLAPNKLSIEKHVLIKHLKCKMYACPHCKSQYWQKSNVEIHIRNTHFSTFDEPIDLKISKKAIISNYIDKVANNTIPDYSKKSAFYSCKICSHIFSRHDKAKYHVIKKHLKVGLYICSECNHYSATKVSTDRHIEEIHPGTQTCAQRAYDVYALFLQSNIQRISNSNPCYSSPAENKCIRQKDSEFYTCSVCNFVAESKLAFSAHSRIHKLYSCFYCDFTTNFLNKMQNHCYVKHPKKPMKHTQISSAKFIHHSTSGDKMSDNEETKEIANEAPNATTEVTIKSEFRSEEDKGKRGCKYEVFSCKLCVYKSNLHAVMRHHVMSHLTYQPYHCPYCPSYSAIRRNIVNNHVKMKHPGFEVKTLCNRIEEDEIKLKNSYEKLSYIEYERRKPSNDQETKTRKLPRIHKSTQYKCCFCSLTTTFHRDIKQHLMREIDYRPFSCKHCSYKDSSRPVVKRHCVRKHRAIAIIENFEQENELQLQKLMSECTFKFYRQAESVEKKEEHLDLPILKISNTQDTLRSSLVYKRKIHKCRECDFEDFNIKHVLLHRYRCHYNTSKCSHCTHFNTNPLQLKKHQHRCKSKKPKLMTSSSVTSSAPAQQHILEGEEANKTLNDVTFCCHVCSDEFKELHSFALHIREQHCAPHKPLSNKPMGHSSECCCLHGRVLKDSPKTCAICSHLVFSPFELQQHLKAPLLPNHNQKHIKFFPFVKIVDIMQCFE